MVSEIIVDVGLNEKRVALLEDKELVEIFIERSDSERLVGNIYRGKVSSVLPGMQAAFIDIGYEKNAFLYVRDAVPQKEDFNEDEDDVYNEMKSYNIDEILRPGQEITVQVTKEPISTKGPRVTTHITLPGRQLVLLPNADYIGISRRIEDEDERFKLKKIAEKIKPENMGLIVRTVSEGKREEDFKNDINFLVKLWKKIKQKDHSGPVPRCIHKDVNVVYRTIRDIFTWNIDKFVINDRQEYNKVLEWVEMVSPALKLRVEYFSKNIDLFEHYQVDAMISKALAKKIWLKCGGYLIIEKTEALTVIDVNTGKYVGVNNLEDTVLRTNKEAAKEITKQLRLRDIGGIIIIDFIDMNESEHRAQIMNVLEDALKKDRTKTTVVDMTRLGLIEMTRKNVREGFASVVLQQCPYCDGKGKILSSESVARNIEKEIKKYFTQTIACAIEVEVHPSVAKVLLGKNDDNLSRIERTFNKRIIIKASDDVKHGEMSIKEVDPDNLLT
ncbi:Rne/Rng family ribonuclease [Herbivorax sp. ANBcel31]|uniref:Rne/Rng family ribonuclease n=1 Tax=Herbivorax sp. ANBcel31 TaxID=3069754 RepID=UPI0027B81FB6|nr:Rne/Rng family ribonuclease [Herbivorax sp. ANBcel31]MDQ2087297.1 Rne/Rng family ribonuclease [Herbivorax sp. ANBcel31]